LINSSEHTSDNVVTVNDFELPNSSEHETNINKVITSTDRSASNLDLHLEIDSEGRLGNETLRQKR